MPETGVLTTTEAAGVFREVASFQAAINDLLFAGFDHADINVLAHEDTVASRLGRKYGSTAEFEDIPKCRGSALYRPKRSATRKVAVIGTGVYVPAIFGSLAVVASGGTMLGACNPSYFRVFPYSRELS
jgi:hypothetical protein